MSQPKLVGCPTCGTEVDHANLGLRDYSRWVNDVLPGKIGGTDLDFVLHQQATGRILVHEYKEANKRLGVGQRLLMTALKQKGIEVWVCWQYSDGTVRVGSLDDTGEIRFTEKMTEAELAAKTRSWWYDGLNSIPQSP